MGMRGTAREVVSSLISIAEVVTATASAVLTILEHEDDDGGDSCEWYGNPAVQCRPPAGADALFVDLDGERVVIGVRETRWMVALEEGETVLRALGGGTPGYIKLKPDGTISAQNGGGTVELSPAGVLSVGGSTDAAALASVLDAVLSAISSAVPAPVSGPDAGEPGLLAIQLALAAYLTSASTKLKVGG
jgi:hypothetical protein